MIRYFKKNFFKRQDNSKRKLKQTRPRETCGIKENTENPYLRSRAIWEELYGSLSTRLNNSYRMNVALVLMLTLSIYGSIHIASQSKIKPYLTVLHGDTPLTISDFKTPEFGKLKSKIAPVAARKFIKDIRSISQDNAVNLERLINALSAVNTSVSQQLKPYLTRRNSYIKDNLANNIKIRSVLLKTSHTIVVRWHEQTINLQSGQVTNNQNYTADLTYQFQEKTQDTMISRHNPLGFTITALAWTEELTHL